jgi:hypothetical protein
MDKLAKICALILMVSGAIINWQGDAIVGTLFLICGLLIDLPNKIKEK